MTTATTPQVARRMFELLEPIALVTFFAPEPHEAMQRLGLRGYWDGYFAGRAAPLGQVPTEVVHALFYSFGPGEATRHLPRVWSTTTPEAALAAREQGCTAALRRILGDLADGPDLARAADLLVRAAQAAPTEGRPLHAALLTVPVPRDPVARLWHATTMLREHRGDGHVSALLAEQVSGIEAHMLLAADLGIAPRSFGRVHHLPAELLDATVQGLQDRGLLGEDEAFTAEGRTAKDRVEALTDRLAAPAYDVLGEAGRDELAALLAPITRCLEAAGSR